MSAAATSLGGMAEAQEPFPNLVLPAGPLDRDAQRRNGEQILSELLSEQDTRVVEMRGGRLPVVHTEAGQPRLQARPPQVGDVAALSTGTLALYVGRLGGASVVALLQPASDEPEQDGATLREVGLGLPDGDHDVFLSALALQHWHNRHPRCPQCGATTHPARAGWVRVCDDDGSEHFPRTDPAVIMAVVDPDDRILLARGPRWSGPHRSVLAGFVEPGETFEQAVARETLEESGVVVDEVTYVGNQPWPFPASLMIGFMARARTLDLVPEVGEIEEIAWYSRADVETGLATGTLRLPGRLSIARRLIEKWYGGPIAGDDFS